MFSRTEQSNKSEKVQEIVPALILRLLKFGHTGDKSAVAVFRSLDHLLLRETIYTLLLLSIYSYAILQYSLFDFVVASMIGYGCSLFAGDVLLTSSSWYTFFFSKTKAASFITFALLLLATCFLTYLNHPVSLWIAFSVMQLLRTFNGVETTAFQKRYWKGTAGKSAFLYTQAEIPLRLVAFLALLVFSSWLSASHLLWTACFIQLVLIFLNRSRKEVETLEEAAFQQPVRGFFRVFWKDQRFIGLLLCVLLLLATISYLLKVLAVEHLQEHLIFEGSSLIFLSLFFSIVFLISWAMTILLTPSFCGKIGVRKTLSFLPAFVLTTFLVGWFVYWGTQHSFPFWNIIIAWGLLLIFERSTQKIALQTLFSPFQYLVKGKGNLWTEFVFRPLYQILIGVLVLVLLLQEAYTTDRTVILLSSASLILLVVSLVIKRPFLLNFKKGLDLRLIENGDLAFQEKGVRKIIEEKAKFGRAEELLFVLDLLEEINSSGLNEVLRSLTVHPHPTVRKKVVEFLPKHGLTSLLESLFDVIEKEHEPAVRTAITKKLFSLNIELASLANLYRYDDRAVYKGGLVGLLQNPDPNKRHEAGMMVAEMACAPSVADKLLVCDVIAETASSNFFEALVLLLHDHDGMVRRKAIQTSVFVKDERLVSYLLQFVKDDDLASEAKGVVISFGELALPQLEKEINESMRETSELVLSLCQICVRIGGEKAQELLWKMVEYPWEELQFMALEGLAQCDFKANSEYELNFISDQLEKIFRRVFWHFSALQILENKAAYDFLFQAIEKDVQQHVQQLERLLGLLFDRKVVELMAEQEATLEPTEQDYWDSSLDVPQENELEEILWQSMPPELAEKYLAIFGYYSYAEKVSKLSEFYSYSLIDEYSVLVFILSSEKRTGQIFNRWTKASAIYSTTDVANQVLLTHLGTYLQKDDLLLIEPAIKTFKRYCQYRGQDFEELLAEYISEPTRIEILKNMATSHTSTLMEIEKVMILKSTRMFADTPESLLADVASVVKEMRVHKGETLFKKGEPGDCMYIIYEGQVRIHDDSRTFTVLIDGDFFGDLGILDTKSRSASATAQTDSLLLRLDQEDFYDLMEKRPEMVRGIIQVLCERIRYQDEMLSKQPKNSDAL